VRQPQPQQQAEQEYEPSYDTETSIAVPRNPTESRVAAHVEQSQATATPKPPLNSRPASTSRAAAIQSSSASARPPTQRTVTHRTLAQTSAGSPATRATVPGRKSPMAAAAAAAQAAADKEIEALGQQIVELLERVRQSEERTAYAEQQLVHMTHMANAAAAAAEALPARNAELDFAMPKAPSRTWLPWTIVGGLGALVVAGFLLGYSPLRSQYEAALKQNEELSARHTQELSSLKSSFNSEKERLESQLAAAQTAAAQAAAAAAVQPTASRSESRSSYSSSHDDDDDSSSSSAEERAARAAERAALREERKAARLAKREERLAKAEERKAERAARAEERKAKRAERSSSHDDAEESLPPPKKSSINPWAASEGSSPSRGGDDPLEGL
jgi:hypothetical protein